MAKKTGTAKRSRSSAKKTTPALRYLRYELTNSSNAGTETSHFIDIARDLSRMNRRLYRQGRDYHVKKITVVSRNTGQSQGPSGATDYAVQAGFISASTVHNTWVSQKAWQRGFKTWQLMNKEASHSISNDVGGTWSDFKVYMTDTMRTGTILAPIDNGGNAWDAGEWTYSKLVTPDGTTGADDFLLHMIGGHNGSAGSRVSVGLIRSYGESRATVSPNAPETPGTIKDDPLVNVFDYGTAIDEVLEDYMEDADNPPYELSNYPGGAANGQKPSVVQMSTLGTDGKCTLGGFQAMCGLIEIESTSPIASDVYSILVELAPGKYRGIKADVI
jgi:hypothetical protein